MIVAENREGKARLTTNRNWRSSIIRFLAYFRK